MSSYQPGLGGLALGGGCRGVVPRDGDSGDQVVRSLPQMAAGLLGVASRAKASGLRISPSWKALPWAGGAGGSFPGMVTLPLSAIAAGLLTVGSGAKGVRSSYQPELGGLALGGRRGVPPHSQKDSQ